VTLTQLEAFVLVARLGSVTAAARTLGVSEPAVSGALASLRQQLGDSLLERGPHGMTLTPGGRRLVPIASQMIALASEAEDAIRQAQGAPERLRVVATSTVAESVAPGLLAAFGSRAGAVEASLGVASSEEMAALLAERLADVALGPRIDGGDLESMPLFRYRLVFVAAPSHPLAARPRLPVRAIADQVWLVGADATDPASPVGRLLGRLAVPERNVRVFASQSAAWTAAADGQGIAPAVAHLVAPELARRSLATLDVAGTPIELLWHATMLRPSRRSGAAAGLARFITTPDATHAMHAPLSGVPPSRFRPPVYVTLWS
jgi:LysR family transcriptional regulator, low CO2-responsive transcriptional regulator